MEKHFFHKKFGRLGTVISDTLFSFSLDICAIITEYVPRWKNEQPYKKSEISKLSSGKREEINSMQKLRLKDILLYNLNEYIPEFILNISVYEPLHALINNHDVVIKTRKNDFKTIMTLIPVIAINCVDEKIPKTQVLILTHTQNYNLVYFSNELRKINCSSGVTFYSCQGGTSIAKDIDALNKGKQVVMGTVGRILDLVSREFLDFSELKLLILNDIDKTMMNFPLIEELFVLPNHTRDKYILTDHVQIFMTFSEKFDTFCKQLLTFIEFMTYNPVLFDLTQPPFS